MLQGSLCVLIAFVVLVSSVTLQHPPDDWKDRIQQGHRIFSTTLRSTNPQLASQNLIPSVGNGYLATVIGGQEVYVGGLFNGKNVNGLEQTPVSHRAHIPAYLNFYLTITEGIFTHSGHGKYGGFAIDFEEGVFYNRMFVESNYRHGFKL
jgi:hypothetical protein